MTQPAVLRARGARRRRRRPRVLVAWLIAGLLLSACGSATPTPAPSGSPPSTPTPAASASPSGDATPTPPGSTIPPLPSGPDRLDLEQVAAGLADPVAIAAAGDGSGRLFVAERGGRLMVVEPGGGGPDPFLDLSGRVLAGGERGLLGVAFHPDFATNRRLFVYYTRTDDGAGILSELRANADGTAVPASSERVLLTQPQPYANHNGGGLAFGPDGYLYLGLGDGGSGGDPLGYGQSTDVLLGKILRLDVDSPPAGGRAYAIPPDNPFAAAGIRPGAGLEEIWAYGLRNPWRISFDPRAGDLYIGDVGQGSWEEIDRQPADSRGGENYGWAVMEGRHCYRTDCDQSPYVKPIAEYSHDLGCSVTGGYVYRGAAQPELNGVYVFGDYCSGTLFTLQVDEGTVTPKPVAQTGVNISSFGMGDDGEIYLADISGGGIYRVVVAG